MKWYIISCFVLPIVIIGCNSNDRKDEKNNLIDEELAKVIDKYIEYKPIEITYGEGLKKYYAKGFSHPSYHIYFEKVKNDTLFTITLFPQLHTFELEPRATEDKDEDVFLATYPKGFFTYKNKYPIIVFDKKSIANKFYNREVLHSIADTLITTNYDDIRDYQADKWIYKMENGKISNRINL
ncbi:hypothetical protein ATE84_5146 [Aquimarina sp. MAR_2010_214]|uniref:hypothetical protein n=1 Tax=Aquimarina sp. MAR_2010_214 TaxID=1250026 RepID=UPI000C707CCA|nr:hypothetical protein [Aquimarina sp. MAR_2010_214]PKV53005.1 hypothetical protein ATE84_5138 [Aquimarina sp. MAR_2010_214]PKV53013.1 hypothetical protein ATE84_5146 [Aquimarina sp. MAR_2010_214]